MDPKHTSLILIGYQNDYFSPDGLLYDTIEHPARVRDVIGNTVRLIEQLSPLGVPTIATPIIFTPDYRELIQPVGILKTIRDRRAFQAGTKGSEMIAELEPFRDRILEIPGRRGLNAFSNTDLDEILRERSITDLVLAGAVTSICVDSTARSAHERGYRVTVLSDCTSARTAFEQEFYCEEILPLYSQVMTHRELLEVLAVTRQS